MAVTLRFGELDPNVFGETHGLDGYPGIVVISNSEEDGRDIGVKGAGNNWHCDMCYDAIPPRGTILYAHEVPEKNGLPLGDTCFAATNKAYDASDAMKDRSRAAGRSSISPPANALIRLRRSRLNAFRRLRIRSSARTPSPARNASTSCGTTRRHRRHGTGRSRLVDSGAGRPYNATRIHLSTSVAGRRFANLGQLHGSTSGNSGLRVAA